MNKYSIILPVRNGGTLVKECVNSILAQTNKDFNLLVLDNNSNDGTLQWIVSLNDDRIIIHPSSVGLSMEANWARIKEIEKGEFITLIGHDDVLHPNYLSEMGQLIAKHPGASLYQTHYSFIDGAGEFMKYCMPMDEIQYGHEFLACQLARTMDSMGTGYMMRSKDYDKLGGIPSDYPNLIFADYELWVRLSLISYKATSGKTCFNYRIHNSVSKLTNGENYQVAFEKYVRFIAALGKENKQVKLVNEKYGHDMLMYFCESLSHRLLKTAAASRKTKVAAFIDSCKTLAGILIPGQPFEPNKKFRINIASQIDSNFLSRSGFYYFKKLTK
jgi:glycosyltransferase involved in cell wall biosynthesis